MDENPAEIPVILFNTMKTALVVLLQETQHRLLKLTAALAGYDLNGLGPLLDRFLHDAVQGRVKRAAI